jgi:endonuclease YncB( thermonuclease family)
MSIKALLRFWPLADPFSECPKNAKTTARKRPIPAQITGIRIGAAVGALLLALFVVVPVIPAKAHSGGLNASGCHNNRRTGDYHCHRPQQSVPRPEPVYTRPQAVTGRYFGSCAEARAAGVAPLREGDDGYRPGLDGDRDGVACEVAGNPTQSQSSGSVADSAPALFPAPVSPVSAPNEPEVIVGQAVATDGDTLVINGKRIRLFGVDAFEAEQRCPGINGSTWGCGGVATRAVQDIVADTQTICVKRDVDIYGRIVAICRADGVDIAAAVVGRGLGVAYTKYSRDYVPEENVAKSQRTGAWIGEFTKPEDYRRSGGLRTTAAIAARSSAASGVCVIKGNVTARGAKYFFLPGDNNYDRVKAEAIFCSEEEAGAAGFERAPE